MVYILKIAVIFVSLPFLLQNNLEGDQLLQEATENSKLLETDPEKAFIEADKIEQRAKRTKNTKAELRAIQTKYIYYQRSNDFENMLAVAKHLDVKAKDYHQPIYQITAKTYLFESYTFSGLTEQGYKELNSALKLLDKLESHDTESIRTRAMLYTSLSNYYSSNKDIENELKYLRLTSKEFESLPDSDYKKQLLYIHNSNLGRFFSKQGELDSAKVYINFSESMDKNFNRTDIRFNNLSILGSVYLAENQYSEALNYLKQAEKLDAGKNHFNLNFLYDNIIQAYQSNGQIDSADIYRAKRDSLNLNITESKNKTLLKLLDEKTESEKTYHYLLYLLGLGAILTLTYFAYRKTKLKSVANEREREDLNHANESIEKENYSKLIKMLQTNDLAFMAFFNEVYPNFTSNLLEKHPEIIQSEIEFYALLKLKLSTNDISKYKNIEPKTVRNKKYLTKKKFGIPKEVDIYQWFSQF